jgi:CheY-like chemotaxis protein
VAKTTSAKSIVLVDDELHNVAWMIEFLEAKGFQVITAENLNDALPIIEREVHRALIIDLNIPALNPLPSTLLERGPPYPSYPGLYLAFQARNAGYRNRQVILYTVHRDPSVTEEANRLGVTYIIKGRPQEIKREIEHVISFDPTSPET